MKVADRACRTRVFIAEEQAQSAESRVNTVCTTRSIMIARQNNNRDVSLRRWVSRYIYIYIFTNASWGSWIIVPSNSGCQHQAILIFNNHLCNKDSASVRAEFILSTLTPTSASPQQKQRSNDETTNRDFLLSQVDPLFFS